MTPSARRPRHQILRGTLITLLLWGLLNSIAPSALANPLGALPGFSGIFAGQRPALGLNDGQLAPCPSTPNCVSSTATDSPHTIAPLTYPEDFPGDIIATLATTIEAQPRSAILTQTDTYLRAEFTSRWMGFVDDVEFYADPETPGKLQVRSASRLGESDLGVNRNRVETLRTALTAALAPGQPT